MEEDKFYIICEFLNEDNVDGDRSVEVCFAEWIQFEENLPVPIRELIEKEVQVTVKRPENQTVGPKESMKKLNSDTSLKNCVAIIKEQSDDWVTICEYAKNVIRYNIANPTREHRRELVKLKAENSGLPDLDQVPVKKFSRPPKNATGNLTPAEDGAGLEDGLPLATFSDNGKGSNTAKKKGQLERPSTSRSKKSSNDRNGIDSRKIKRARECLLSNNIMDSDDSEDEEIARAFIAEERIGKKVTKKVTLSEMESDEDSDSHPSELSKSDLVYKVKSLEAENKRLRKQLGRYENMKTITEDFPQLASCVKDLISLTRSAIRATGKENRLINKDGTGKTGVSGIMADSTNTPITATTGVSKQPITHSKPNFPQLAPRLQDLLSPTRSAIAITATTGVSKQPISHSKPSDSVADNTNSPRTINGVSTQSIKQSKQPITQSKPSVKPGINLERGERATSTAPLFGHTTIIAAPPLSTQEDSGQFPPETADPLLSGVGLQSLISPSIPAEKDQSSDIGVNASFVTAADTALMAEPNGSEIIEEMLRFGDVTVPLSRVKKLKHGKVTILAGDLAALIFGPEDLALSSLKGKKNNRFDDGLPKRQLDERRVRAIIDYIKNTLHLSELEAETEGLKGICNKLNNFKKSPLAKEIQVKEKARLEALKTQHEVVEDGVANPAMEQKTPGRVLTPNKQASI